MEDEEEKEELEEDSSAAAERTVGARLALAAELAGQAEILMAQVRQILQQSGLVSDASFRRPAQVEQEGDAAMVIEGVFDGQRMIGPDGKHYAVPANYASKSKLVEGDLLKLTITDRGAFVYKQIGPMPRRRLKGDLMLDPTTREYAVKVSGRTYHVLKASVTYFRGHEGEEAVILVPESGESKWAAVENILKPGQVAPPMDAPTAPTLREEMGEDDDL